MKTMNATDARKNFQEIINSVHYTKEIYVIVKRGKPWVMVQPLREEDTELIGLKKMLQKQSGEKKTSRKSKI